MARLVRAHHDLGRHADLFVRVEAPDHGYLAQSLGLGEPFAEVVVRQHGTYVAADGGAFGRQITDVLGHGFPFLLRGDAAPENGHVG